MKQNMGESVMIILSADHDIRPRQAFIEGSNVSVDWASKQNGLIVFGHKTSRAETGYGIYTC